MFSVEALIKQHMSLGGDNAVFINADIGKFINKLVTNSFSIMVEATNDDIVKSCFSFYEIRIHYITLKTDDVVAVIYQQQEV